MEVGGGAAVIEWWLVVGGRKQEGRGEEWLWLDLVISPFDFRWWFGFRG